MPSTSAAQAKLMSAVAHGWQPAGAAQKNLPPLAVAKEFHEADKKAGKFMHYKADGGKIEAVKGALGSLIHRYLPSPEQKLARIGSQLTDRGVDPYNTVDAAARRAAEQAETDRWLSSALQNPDNPAKADGGKVGALVNFAKAGTKALMDRLEGAFHNPYTADPEQVRRDIAKYWQTNAPPAPPPMIAAPKPAEPSVADLTAQLHELVNKPQMAEGGPFDSGEPKHRVRTLPSTSSQGLGIDPMMLIRHAADRVSATVSDDPHHMLARIAGGLTSQLAGLSPSGKAEFGRVPGIVAETKAIPGGLMDLGKGLLDLGGTAANAAQAKGYQSPGLAALQALQGGIDRLQDKYGDLAPAFSRKAEAASDKLHSAVHRQMGLSAPRGVAENLAEAGGMMLGQIPVVGQEEKAASMLGKLAKSPIEWLSPSTRPSLANYSVGTLAGGMMGAAGDPDQPPPTADNSMPMKERFE